MHHRNKPARRLGGAPAVTSTMIIPGSTRIEPNTILSPCPAICSLARRIGGSPVKYEDVPPPQAPNAILRTRHDKKEEHQPGVRGLLLVWITMMMIMMIVVAVAVVLTLPLLSVSCFYIALHCYDVTITNNTNKHTCNNIF